MKAFTPLLIASLLLLIACNPSGNRVIDSQTMIDTHGDTIRKNGPVGYTDRMLFDLTGDVREVVRTAYYNVSLVDDKYIPDTAAANRRTFAVLFDELGNYVPTENETVRRDDLGRMTYWRDSRPNGSINPGLLRDTLSYTYAGPNLLITDGMGELTLAVIDNSGRMVGQYSRPMLDDIDSAAFNVILEEDPQGNWTRRATVWITRNNKQRPAPHYTLEEREIFYF